MRKGACCTTLPTHAYFNGVEMLKFATFTVKRDAGTGGAGSFIIRRSRLPLRLPLPPFPSDFCLRFGGGSASSNGAFLFVPLSVLTRPADGNEPNDDTDADEGMDKDLEKGEEEEEEEEEEEV